VQDGLCGNIVRNITVADGDHGQLDVSKSKYNLVHSKEGTARGNSGSPFFYSTYKKTTYQYKQNINTKELFDMSISDDFLANYSPPIPKLEDAFIQLETLPEDQVSYITNLLNEQVVSHLIPDVSNYASGRMRVWMPYEAPLDSPNSKSRPFTPGLLNHEVWQWIVDLCAKHGFQPDTCLISKNGSIKPHRDTTYASSWALGINLGQCKWNIAIERDLKVPNHTMDFVGGEVFNFDCKHVHSVTDVIPDRWSINVWSIANTSAARNNNIQGRLDDMLTANQDVRNFIQSHNGL
jgi:hypothetical protein